MAELSTITLGELEEVDSLQDTDTILVERGGRIKRFTGEVGGGGVCVVNLDDYENEGGESGGGVK